MIPNHGFKVGTTLALVFCLVAFSATIGWSDDPDKKQAESGEDCVEAAAGPLTDAPAAAQQSALGTAGYRFPAVRVGKAAPDFEATAFYEGGFKKVKLSDYAGKWVVLCFYPGDFTFV